MNGRRSVIGMTPARNANHRNTYTIIGPEQEGAFGVDSCALKQPVRVSFFGPFIVRILAAEGFIGIFQESAFT